MDLLWLALMRFSSGHRLEHAILNKEDQLIVTTNGYIASFCDDWRALVLTALRATHPRAGSGAAKLRIHDQPEGIDGINGLLGRIDGQGCQAPCTGKRSRAHRFVGHIELLLTFGAREPPAGYRRLSGILVLQF